MGRKLRYIPEGGALVEVTCRTFHSHFLLRLGGDLDGIIVGVQQKRMARFAGGRFSTAAALA
jgi:hypothetical protein